MAQAVSGNQPMAGKHPVYITDKEEALLRILNLQDSDISNDYQYQPPGGKPKETMVLANKGEQKSLKDAGGAGKKTKAGMKTYYMEGGATKASPSGSSAPSKGVSPGGGGSTSKGVSPGGGGSTSKGVSPGGGGGNRDDRMPSAPAAKTVAKTSEDKSRTDRAPALTQSGPGKTSLPGQLTQSGPGKTNSNVTTINKTPAAPKNNVTEIFKTPAPAGVPMAKPQSSSYYGDLASDTARERTVPSGAPTYGPETPITSKLPGAGRGLPAATPTLRDDRMPSQPVSQLSKLATVTPKPASRPVEDTLSGIPESLRPQMGRLESAQYNPNRYIPSTPEQLANVPMAKTQGRIPGVVSEPGSRTANKGLPYTNVFMTNPPVPRDDRQPATGNDVSQQFVDTENANYEAANRTQGPIAPAAPPKIQDQLAADPSATAQNTRVDPFRQNSTLAAMNNTFEQAPDEPAPAPPPPTADQVLTTQFLNQQVLNNPGQLADVSQGDTGQLSGETPAISPLPPFTPPAEEPALPGEPTGPTPVDEGPTESGGIGAAPFIPGVTPLPPVTPVNPMDDPYGGVMPWDREAYESLKGIFQGMGMEFTPDQFVAMFYQQGAEPAPPKINYTRPKQAPVSLESGQSPGGTELPIVEQPPVEELVQ